MVGKQLGRCSYLCSAKAAIGRAGQSYARRSCRSATARTERRALLVGVHLSVYYRPFNNRIARDDLLKNIC